MAHLGFHIVSQRMENKDMPGKDKTGPGEEDRRESKQTDEAVEEEALKKWSGKSKLERTLQLGARGPLQLRRKERQHHLGEFRERVIRALTVGQVEEKGTYPEILEAMDHPQAAKLVVSRNADLSAASEYIKAAKEKGLHFTTVDSPSFKGELGLVVAANAAADVSQIAVPSRKEKLKAAGIPEEIIAAAGEKICSRCYDLIRERVPEERLNYREQGFFDRLWGHKCPCGG